jgi:hypothetical protein
MISGMHEPGDFELQFPAKKSNGQSAVLEGLCPDKTQQKADQGR